ncbi:MAG: tetratricopeptide repeat protein [Bdellovibrionales bacterium]|nr:tetratricopeptide repeat protein [Bdellovibrionales bacterium]
MIYRALGICFCLFAACALPTSEVEDQSFVPIEELEVVSLVREGLDYFKRARYIDAQFAFLQANYLAPDAKNIQLNLAMSFREQGNFDEAESLFMTLLKDEPDSTEYLSGLAGLYLQRLEFDRAMDMYERVYEIAEKRSDLTLQVSTLSTLTVAAFQRGQVERAKCYAEEAYALSKDIVVVSAYLRILLSESDRESTQRVISEYRKAVVETDARILYLQSMALFLEDALEDIMRLRKEIRFAKNFEFIKTEFSLLEVVAIKLLEEQGRLDSVREYLPEHDEDSDEDEEDLLLTLYGGKALEIEERLFWPYEFTIQLERLLKISMVEAGIEPDAVETVEVLY